MAGTRHGVELNGRVRVTWADPGGPTSVARVLPAVGVRSDAHDAVIDDASHAFRDQGATLLLLRDYPRPGGRT